MCDNTLTNTNKKAAFRNSDGTFDVDIFVSKTTVWVMYLLVVSSEMTNQQITQVLQAYGQVIKVVNEYYTNQKNFCYCCNILIIFLTECLRKHARMPGKTSENPRLSFFANLNHSKSADLPSN